MSLWNPLQSCIKSFQPTTQFRDFTSLLQIRRFCTANTFSHSQDLDYSKLSTGFKSYKILTSTIPFHKTHLDLILQTTCSSPPPIPRHNTLSILRLTREFPRINLILSFLCHFSIFRYAFFLYNKSAHNLTITFPSFPYLYHNVTIEQRYKKMRNRETWGKEKTNLMKSLINTLVKLPSNLLSYSVDTG